MMKFRKTVTALVAVAATTLAPVAVGLSSPASAATYPTTEGGYTPVTPARLLDTRTGLGRAGTAPVGQTTAFNLQVTGRGGVPSSGVRAVVINLTTTGGTADSYFTAWPAGQGRPATSNLNFRRGETRANLVTVSLGANGQIGLYNNSGAAHMIADVVGYYQNATGSGQPTGSYYPITPDRLFDSREEPDGLTYHGDRWTFSLDYGFDMSAITAVAVNITAINPTAPGYLKAWSGAGDEPTASSVNYAPGDVTPNMAIVPTTMCVDCGFDPDTDTTYSYPEFDVSNYVGTLHFAIDLVGLYDDGGWEGPESGATRYKALATPQRIVDTRTNLGTSTLGAAQSRSITTPESIAGIDTWALSANVTAVQPSLSTYVTAWPGGIARPTVSNLNAAPGRVVANMAQIGVGASNDFQLYNNSGTVNLVVDVNGTFEAYPASGTVTGRIAPRERVANLPGELQGAASHKH